MNVIICPECKKQHKITDQMFGRKVRCENCNNIFVIGTKIPTHAVPQIDKESKTSNSEDESQYSPITEEGAPANPYRFLLKFSYKEIKKLYRYSQGIKAVGVFGVILGCLYLFASVGIRKEGEFPLLGFLFFIQLTGSGWIFMECRSKASLLFVISISIYSMIIGLIDTFAWFSPATNGLDTWMLIILSLCIGLPIYAIYSAIKCKFMFDNKISHRRMKYTVDSRECGKDLLSAEFPHGKTESMILERVVMATVSFSILIWIIIAISATDPRSTKSEETVYMQISDSNGIKVGMNLSNVFPSSLIGKFKEYDYDKSQESRYEKELADDRRRDLMAIERCRKFREANAARGTIKIGDIDYNTARIMHLARPDKYRDPDTFFDKSASNKKSRQSTSEINNPETFKKILKEAKTLSDNGDYDSAIIAYKKAIEIDPEYAGTYINLGDTLSKKGNYDLAIKVSGKAIEIDPRATGAYINIGHAFMMKGDIEAAIGAYRKSTEIDPKCTVGYALLGCLLSAKGDYGSAVWACRKAIEIEPKSPIGYIMLICIGHNKNDKVMVESALELAESNGYLEELKKLFGTK